MKLAPHFKSLITIVMISGYFSSCSDDDIDANPSCYQDFNISITRVVTSAKGTIRGLSSDYCLWNFTIEPDESVHSSSSGLLATCNMAQSFKVDSARVVFSGYYFRNVDDLNICADFFEITDIQFENE